jgi:hypothetical protein
MKKGHSEICRFTLSVSPDGVGEATPPYPAAPGREGPRVGKKEPTEGIFAVVDANLPGNSIDPVNNLFLPRRIRSARRNKMIISSLDN